MEEELVTALDARSPSSAASPASIRTDAKLYPGPIGRWLLRRKIAAGRAVLPALVLRTVLFPGALASVRLVSARSRKLALDAFHYGLPFVVLPARALERGGDIFTLAVVKRLPAHDASEWDVVVEGTGRVRNVAAISRDRVPDHVEIEPVYDLNANYAGRDEEMAELRAKCAELISRAPDHATREGALQLLRAITFAAHLADLTVANIDASADECLSMLQEPNVQLRLAIARRLVERALAAPDTAQEASLQRDLRDSSATIVGTE